MLLTLVQLQQERERERESAKQINGMEVDLEKAKEGDVCGGETQRQRGLIQPLK